MSNNVVLEDNTQIERYPPGWLPAEDIPSIVNAAGWDKVVGIEIGVDSAMSTTWLLDNIPNLTLYGVDPYEEYSEMPDRPLSYESMVMYTKKYGYNFRLIQKRSDDAVTHFADESIDFVFIDGMHQYEQCKRDIENYYPKIKSGGYIFGHDYHAWKNNVDRAVNEFILESKQKIDLKFCKQDVWYWRKE